MVTRTQISGECLLVSVATACLAASIRHHPTDTAIVSVIDSAAKIIMQYNFLWMYIIKMFDHVLFVDRKWTMCSPFCSCLFFIVKWIMRQESTHEIK